MTGVRSEVDRDTFPFPVAVPSGIGPFRLAVRERAFDPDSRLWHRWGLAEVGGRIEMPGSLHTAKMEKGLALAKR